MMHILWVGGRVTQSSHTIYRIQTHTLTINLLHTTHTHDTTNAHHTHTHTHTHHLEELSVLCMQLCCCELKVHVTRGRGGCRHGTMCCDGSGEGGWGGVWDANVCVFFINYACVGAYTLYTHHIYTQTHNIYPHLHTPHPYTHTHHIYTYTPRCTLSASSWPVTAYSTSPSSPSSEGPSGALPAGCRCTRGAGPAGESANASCVWSMVNGQHICETIRILMRRGVVVVVAHACSMCSVYTKDKHTQKETNK